MIYLDYFSRGSGSIVAFLSKMEDPFLIQVLTTNLDPTKVDPKLNSHMVFIRIGEEPAEIEGGKYLASLIQGALCMVGIEVRPPWSLNFVYQ